MRVRGNVSPESLSIEPFAPMPGYVEVRLRENIKDITAVDEMTDQEVPMFEYDEYTFHLANKEGLREEIEGNMSDWLITGRTLEINEGASIVQDMKEALEIVGGEFMNMIEQAQAIREAMDYAGASLDEDTALICVALYRPWAVGVSYKVNDYFTYGVNSVGDPQLYRVVQAHTSQADWTPDSVPALYTPIGLTEEGYPVWSQPTGGHDAYNTGDIVQYNGKLYKSLIDGNVWSPDTYPQGWEEYTPDE
jgi:hypothetical protein